MADRLRESQYDKSYSPKGEIATNLPLHLQSDREVEGGRLPSPMAVAGPEQRASPSIAVGLPHGELALELHVCRCWCRPRPCGRASPGAGCAAALGIASRRFEQPAGHGLRLFLALEQMCSGCEIAHGPGS